MSVASSRETMANLEVSGMNKISNSNGIGGNYHEKSSTNLNRNEVSPCVDPVVKASMVEAKKIEQYYQHIYKMYKEVQLNFNICYTGGKSLKYRSCNVGFCIGCCKNVVKELQNVLDMLNIEKMPQRKTKTPNYRKKFLLLHGCSSLAQENMLLQQKKEHKQPKHDVMLYKETIDFKGINWEYRQIQRYVPKDCGKKHVHNLLRKLKKTYKLDENDMVQGAMVGDHTSQDKLENSISISIKILVMVTKELEKEKKEADDMLRDEVRLRKEDTKKIMHILKKKKSLSGEVDNEIKNMLRLKEIYGKRNHGLPYSLTWYGD